MFTGPFTFLCRPAGINLRYGLRSSSEHSRVGSGIWTGRLHPGDPGADLGRGTDYISWLAGERTCERLGLPATPCDQEQISSSKTDNELTPSIGGRMVDANCSQTD